jgi:DnaB-like helicase N terminal domain
MPDLTSRAEQALLGALIREPGQIHGARFVTVTDFADPQNRTVFAALIALYAGHLDGARLPADLPAALTAQEPAINPGHLTRLTEACPRPQHAATYARMVIEAGLRRQLTSHADRLAEQAHTLYQEVGRLTGATGPGHGAEAFPAHLLKLAHTMLTHSWGLDPPSSHDLSSSRTVQPQPPAPAPATSTPANHLPDARARQEEDILADLITHFRPNSNVLTWLPADAFTPGPRREVYQAIMTLTRNSEAVDPLTVDWQLARNTALTQATSPATGPAGTGPVPEGYVSRLAVIPVRAGTATLTGRILLNQYATAQQRARTAAANGHHQPGRSAATAPGHDPARFDGVRPRRPGHPPLLQPPPGRGSGPRPAGPEPSA